MKKFLKKNIIFVFILIISCGQNLNTQKFNKQSTKYKVCLKDANHNIERKININQDRIEMLLLPYQQVLQLIYVHNLLDF